MGDDEGRQKKKNGVALMAWQWRLTSAKMARHRRQRKTKRRGDKATASITLVISRSGTVARIAAVSSIILLMSRLFSPVYSYSDVLCMPIRCSYRGMARRHGAAAF